MLAAADRSGPPHVAERVYLPWSEKALPAAAAWFLSQGATGNGIDLEQAVCVTPGARAGRLLLWHLARAAGERQLALIPPRLVTPGHLVEALAPVEGPCATRIERLSAWAAVLVDGGTNDQAGLRALLGSAAPRNAMECVRLAERLVDIEDELSGADHDMSAVESVAARLAGETEAARWRALSQAQREVRRRLAEAGLVDPALARRQASDTEPSPVDLPRHIILIGVIELNRVQRRVIERCAGAGCRITVLIHAPEGSRAEFDAAGCLDVAAWAERVIDLDDAQIVIADRATDLAQSVLDVMAEVAPAPSAAQVTIGLADSSLGPDIELAGALAGIDVRPASGRPAATTAPWQILVGCARAMSGGDTARRQLLELPAVSTWLERIASANVPGDILSAADESMMAARPGGCGDPRVWARLRAALEKHLEPLHGPPRALAAWVAPIEALLAAVLDRAMYDPAGEAAVGALAAELRQWGDIPAALGEGVTFGGADALHLLAGAVRRDTVSLTGRG